MKSEQKDKPHLSFRVRLRTGFLSLALILLVTLSLTFYLVSSGIISDIGTRLSEDNAKNLCLQVESYFDSINQNSVQFVRLKSLQNILDKESAGEISPSESSALLNDLQLLMDYSGSIAGIDYTMYSIYCRNGYSLTTDPSVQMPFSDFDSCLGWYQTSGFLDSTLRKETWCQLLKTTTVYGKVQYSFVFLRPLYSPSTYELSGILLAAVSESSIRSSFADSNPDAFILHRSGTVVSSGKNSLIGQNLSADPSVSEILKGQKKSGTITFSEEGTEHMLSYRLVGNNETYAVVPFQYFRGLDKSEFFHLSVACIVISGIVFLLAVLISTRLSYSLSLSLNKITEAVKRIESGERNLRLSCEDSDEFRYLSCRINTMLDQIDSDEKKQQEWLVAQQTLKLQLLQSQFNPHLLYNCLNTALYSLQTHDSSQAELIISSMTSFFQRSLSPCNDIITLEEELELMQSYMELERKTHGNTCLLESFLSADLLSVKLPKFTLQPMIENSVVHGFRMFREDGRITITGHMESGCAYIEVLDNGIGIDEDLLEELNRRLAGGSMPKDGSSFGLCNVNLRLRNVYGPGTGIHLESESGEYTRVRIVLDLNNDKEASICTE